MNDYDTEFFKLTSDEMSLFVTKIAKLEDEIFNTTFRNAIIVGISEIDHSLEYLLKKKLKTYNHSGFNVIDSMNFITKIDLSFGIGLIGKNFTDLLHKLRKVRNKLAHSSHISNQTHYLFNTVYNNLYKHSSIYTLLITSLHNEYYEDKIHSEIEGRIIAALFFLLALLHIKSINIKEIEHSNVIEIYLRN